MTELQVTINSLKEVLIAGELILEKIEKVRKDLEKPSPHKWEHGDIYEARWGNIMIYLKFTEGCPQTVCIVGPTYGLVKEKYMNLQDAKFLFNIREKL